ncbi:MAG: segregation/condensation protein A [Clostridia bacterium]
MVSYQIKLENYEGPLDLLLHLIDENKMSIYDIKIAVITEQYLDHLMAMQEIDMEIASDFLVMAATLLHIKSRSLLPKNKDEKTDSEADLIAQLIAYKKFKIAGERFRSIHETGQQYFYGTASHEDFGVSEKTYILSKSILTMMYRETIQKQMNRTNEKAIDIKEIIKKEKFSLAGSIRKVIDVLFREKRISFFDKFKSKATSKLDLVTDFLSLLILSGEKKVLLKQKKPFDDIFVESTDNLSYSEDKKETYDWE